jgi:hypothetical protein
MAKLNWQKLWHKTQDEINLSADKKTIRTDKYFIHKGKQKTLNSGIWPTGKHSGTPVNKLPEHYLIWAGQYLHIKHLKHQANKELIRRYHSGEIKITSHKVGGPDNNTTV